MKMMGGEPGDWRTDAKNNNTRRTRGRPSLLLRPMQVVVLEVAGVVIDMLVVGGFLARE
jgi:hypothetical protein